MNSVPQGVVKGLAGEFLREELGDVLPVQLDCWSWCNNSWRPFWIFYVQFCGTVLLHRLRFMVADVADQVAWRTNRDTRTGFKTYSSFTAALLYW